MTRDRGGPDDGSSGRHIPMHSRPSALFVAPFTSQSGDPCNSGSCGERGVFFDPDTTRHTSLGDNTDIRGNPHIVANLNEVVDFGSSADHGPGHCRAVDGRIRPNVDVIIDLDMANLWNLAEFAIGRGGIAEAVTPNYSSAVDLHSFTDDGVRVHRYIREDDRVVADLNVFADVDTRIDVDTIANARAISDKCPARNVDIFTDNHMFRDDRAAIDTCDFPRFPVKEL